MRYIYLIGAIILLSLFVALIVKYIKKGGVLKMALQQPLPIIFGVAGVALLTLAAFYAPAGTQLTGINNNPSSVSTNNINLPGGISLSRLTSPTNYSYTLAIGYSGKTTTINGKVYSPTRWETDYPLKIIHVGTKSYVKIGTKWQSSNESAADSIDNTLSGAAKQFLGMVKNPTMTAHKGDVCEFANTAGHVWTIYNTDGTIETVVPMSACIADIGGALLQVKTGVSNALDNNQNRGDVFTITSIGSVKPIQIPSPLAGN